MGIVSTLILILAGLIPAGPSSAGTGRALSSGQFINLDLEVGFPLRLRDTLRRSPGLDDHMYVYPFSNWAAMHGALGRNLPSASSCFLNPPWLQEQTSPVDEPDRKSEASPLQGIRPQRDRIDFGRIAPHVGIDWRHQVGKARRWIVSFDLGVAYRGTPQVGVSPGDALSSKQRSWADLENPKHTFADQMRDPKPLVAFGLTYKF